MSHHDSRICPVELAGGLDNKIRRWVQNPRKILAPYVKAGMTVMDIGCGPGFFTLEMAQMVGESGRVIACDVQEGMLQILQQKIAGTPLAGRITLHQCGANQLGVAEKIDFALAFYMVHEVPGQQEFFAEIAALLKPEALLFIVEPPLHVSGKAFRRMIENAQAAGLEPLGCRKLFLSKTLLLRRAGAEGRVTPPLELR
jgi:ubiquinone/menaquinone biosynthesis C-methylase UbiE